MNKQPATKDFIEGLLVGLVIGLAFGFAMVILIGDQIAS